MITHKIKNNIWKILCVLLAVAIAGVFWWGQKYGGSILERTYEDGIEQIDLKTIYLEDSDVQVNFSEILLGKQEETRKLIVSTQEATVSTELSDQLIKNIDFDFMKKTQKVSYTGKGYFVVDLDDLMEENIVDNKENKTLTIRISHAYLQAIEINPDNIIIDEVKEGLFARGDIELTVSDYSVIEKELRSRLEKEFNTVKNGQEADDIALQMVKEVYEPIVKAINPKYNVYVEFR